ncbi:MAG: hypothetical protein H3C31_07270 [Brumimicrobium sp.]|nr:hypothetical protein [Brumimicrobium sp.]MCO5267857.1 hypothetical protein [Brumimicrobium sp.]
MKKISCAISNKTLFLLGICLLLAHTFSWGQRKVEEAIGTPYIGIHYGANWPGGAYAQRYGFTNMLGSHAGYKTKKNWIYALDGNFLFGNKIKVEGLIQNLMDSNGNILNTSGGSSIVLLFNRGFNINASVGKIIPVWNPNPNSGITITLDAGYFWNRLRIETQEDEVPQLRGDYLKGYDRLEIGVNTSEFIGYTFMANRGIFNFYAGFYFQQQFTRDQRDIFWDHPNELVDKKIRIGHLFGLRAGWLIPIYKRMPKEFYYN